MKAEISNLVKLQARDDEIRTLESRLAAIPKEVEALEREIATEKNDVKAAEDALAESQKRQRAAEGELSTAEEKASKYQNQLMSVKSNEEYTAMQKQIEATKNETGDVETKILQGLDTLEELEQERAAREQELKEGQKKVSGMEKELDDEKVKLEAELAERQEARVELLSVIPEDLFEEYQKNRGNTGRRRHGGGRGGALSGVAWCGYARKRSTSSSSGTSTTAVAALASSTTWKKRRPLRLDRDHSHQASHTLPLFPIRIKPLVRAGGA